MQSPAGGGPPRGLGRVGPSPLADSWARKSSGGPGLLPPRVSLSAALLYKPVDRVTRSTLVLHVSRWARALGFLAPAASGRRWCFSAARLLPRLCRLPLLKLQKQGAPAVLGRMGAAGGAEQAPLVSWVLSLERVQGGTVLSHVRTAFSLSAWPGPEVVSWGCGHWAHAGASGLTAASRQGKGVLERRRPGRAISEGVLFTLRNNQDTETAPNPTARVVRECFFLMYNQGAEV